MILNNGSRMSDHCCKCEQVVNVDSAPGQSPPMVMATIWHKTVCHQRQWNNHRPEIKPDHPNISHAACWHLEMLAQMSTAVAKHKQTFAACMCKCLRLSMNISQP